MSKLFYLKTSQREHVLRHFHAKDMAGSHFYSEVFVSPEGLLDYINSVEPIHTFQQSRTRNAYCFVNTSGQAVGTSGLAKSSDLDENCIIRQIRDGYTIEIGLVDLLPETHSFCVIADESPDGLSVITAFPGDYARPFALKSQPADEYELNKKFWEEHVLLKLKNTIQ